MSAVSALKGAGSRMEKSNAEIILVSQHSRGVVCDRRTAVHFAFCFVFSTFWWQSRFAIAVPDTFVAVGGSALTAKAAARYKVGLRHMAARARIIYQISKLPHAEFY